MLLDSPTHFAHKLWSTFLKVGDYAIDATAGNGHDTLFLAQSILSDNQGKLIAFDIQREALAQTQKLLSDKCPSLINRIELKLASHSQMKELCAPKAQLIVFNLGYLPGSDKSITTLTKTTLESLNQAVDLLDIEGILSITCYPGHLEGQKESAAVLDWAGSLLSQFNVTKQEWINRSDKSPFLLLVQKKLVT